MKEITKKEMMQYRFNGNQMIRIQLKKYPIQNKELKRQVELNIKKFETHADLMKYTQSKSEVRENYIELVNVVTTIKSITENQETLVSMLSNI